MQTLWSELEEKTDLFAYWGKELELRHNFRQDFTLDYIVELENAEQIDFLYRALYLVGRREEFFILLISKATKAFVLNWLRETDISVTYNLLQFIPSYILHYKPNIGELQFLIHIYMPRYDEYFRPIIDLLNGEECNFLAHKTANHNLRKLLLKRKTQIENEQQDYFYGFEFTKNLSPLPTIYGDKVGLIITAIEHIQQNQDRVAYNLMGDRRYFTHLLDLAEQLFAIGLVADGLHMLLLIYKDYEKNNKILDLVEDEIIFKAFNRQVRRMLPMYALLYQKEAFNFSLQFYQEHFPRLAPDIASLTYLQVYEKLTLSPPNFTNALLDIYPVVSQIKQIRPDETSLLYDYEIRNKVTPERFQAILTLIESKLLSLPHEAFISLDYLQNLLKHDFTTAMVNKDLLAEIYLRLFTWLPSPLFINNFLVADLAKDTSPEIKEELEKRLKLISYYETNSIWQDMAEKPDLIKNESIRRLIVTGKFMGVL